MSKPLATLTDRPWAKRHSLRGVLLILAGLLVPAWTGIASARMEADPNKEYVVTPADGPWMICTASYMGAPARKQAHDLVLELRRRYDLPAFVFNRGAEERSQQQEAMEKERQERQAYLQRMGYSADVPVRHRTVRIEDQYAVLVGGYKDIDTARQALDQIKKLQPPKTVKADSNLKLDTDPSSVNQIEGQRDTSNPFTTSFVVRNPTVSVDAAAKTPDPGLVPWNEGESLSLLNCRKSWTLLVKVFPGASNVMPQSAPKKFMDELLNRKTGAQLEASGHNAHNLAEALRKMGFEAYVLHTRYSSIVTVGAYDSQEDPHMQEVLVALTSNLSLGTSHNDSPQITQQLQLMPRPVPMQVPRP